MLNQLQDRTIPKATRIVERCIMDKPKPNTKPADPKVWDKPRRVLIITFPTYKNPKPKPLVQ